MNVLLVEDDRDVGSCLRRGIEGAGHTLDWTGEGRQAFECASSSRYDAIIVDLGLPDIDGIALCAKLRQLSRSLPILVLTERDRMADRLESFAAGADDVLAKPFDFDELMARLAAIRRRRMPERTAPAAPPTQLIVLDGKSGAARRRSRVVGLTDRERRFFDVLLGRETERAPLTAAFVEAFGHDLDGFDERAEASGNRFDFHRRVAIVWGIGRKLVRSGTRLRRRRAST